MKLLVESLQLATGCIQQHVRNSNYYRAWLMDLCAPLVRCPSFSVLSENYTWARIIFREYFAL